MIYTYDEFKKTNEYGTYSRLYSNSQRPKFKPAYVVILSIDSEVDIQKMRGKFKSRRVAVRGIIYARLVFFLEFEDAFLVEISG